MLSVGFKDLIEKCEEYFGKGVTKACLAIIGASVVVFVIGVAIPARSIHSPFGLAG